jgi:general secretion pathway protein K
VFPDSKQKGVALVLVLWITVLLTIMAGAFTLTLQREAKLIGNLKARSEANALAEAGVYYALLMLSVNAPERAWKADGSIRELAFNDGVVAIQASDERGKIDLNYAGRDLLVAMFTGINLELGEADKLTDAILDWRDKNDEVHLNGAEKKDYKQHNLSYAPRNGLFQSIEELQFVLGMTPRVFKEVEPMLTVYSRMSAVDKTKASDEVLRVLEALAEDGTDKNAGPSGAARLDGNSVANAERDTETDTENAGEDGGSSRSRSFGTGIYTIDAEALLPGGHTGRIRVVVRRGLGSAAGFTILSWKYITAPSNGLLRENPEGDGVDFY